MAKQQNSNLVEQRISFLSQIFHINPYYSRCLHSISLKTKTPLHPLLKRTACKKCYNTETNVRIIKKRTCVTCTKCGGKRTFLCKSDRLFVVDNECEPELGGKKKGKNNKGNNKQ